MRLLGLIIKWRLEDEYGTLNIKSTKNSELSSTMTTSSTTPHEYNTTHQSSRDTSLNTTNSNDISTPIIQKENGFV